MRLLKPLIIETAALLLVGDGVVALLQPRRHVRLWRLGPAPWRRLMRAFERRPLLTAGLGALEAALGLWIAARQRPRAA